MWTEVAAFSCEAVWHVKAMTDGEARSPPADQQHARPARVPGSIPVSTETFFLLMAVQVIKHPAL